MSGSLPPPKMTKCDDKKYSDLRADGRKMRGAKTETFLLTRISFPRIAQAEKLDILNFLQHSDADHFNLSKFPIINNKLFDIPNVATETIKDEFTDRDDSHFRPLNFDSTAKTSTRTWHSS